MGENGAGKSTLGKILAGICRPDEGEIEIDGTVRHFHSSRDALNAGIGLIHQELSYCPNLTVAENLCLGAMPRRGMLLDAAAMAERTRQCLARVGATCSPSDEMGRLTAGQIQLVQIASALSTGAHILVMDEPTSSLSLVEAQKLESLIAELRSQGTTILYVSHRMEEIFRLCDTVTVLRDGRHVATLPVAGSSEDDLVRMMIGRSLEAETPAHLQKPLGKERLRVESLTSPGHFHDVSFTLHAGEVLGVAGLVGAGRSEVAQAVFGMDPMARGRIFVNGAAVTIRNPAEALANSIGLVTEDRQRTGIVPEMSCGENLTLASLGCSRQIDFLSRFRECPRCPKQNECLRFWDWVRLGREQEWIGKFFARLRVRTSTPDVPIAALSGGNQQKIMLGKCLTTGCSVLMLDEPTRGVDVGAKAEIHRLIDELAVAGHAVLMISSELPEVLRLSTRVLVMRNGRVAGIVDRADATEENIVQLMAGRKTAQGAQYAN